MLWYSHKNAWDDLSNQIRLWSRSRFDVWISCAFRISNSPSFQRWNIIVDSNHTSYEVWQHCLSSSNIQEFHYIHVQCASQIQAWEEQFNGSMRQGVHKFSLRKVWREASRVTCDNKWWRFGQRVKVQRDCWSAFAEFAECWLFRGHSREDWNEKHAAVRFKRSWRRIDAHSTEQHSILSQSHRFVRVLCFSHYSNRSFENNIIGE